MSFLRFGGVGCALSLVAAVVSLAAETDAKPGFRSAPLAFVATLKTVQAGPVAQSFPPIHTFTLTFEKAEAPLRGVLPKTLVFSHQVRAVEPPALAVGTQYIVTAGGTERPTIVQLLPASPERIAEAKDWFSLPLGWSRQDGKLISPWAARGEHAWLKEETRSAEPRCTKTGRPALMAGAGISLKVEQVIPKDAHEFKNPFGDGQFTVTVTNTGKEAVTVPALVKDGDEIRWHDSLVVLYQDQPLLLPRTKPLDNPVAVKLSPGESVSTVIDAMLLDNDPMWPRGGSRVYFTFALGEVATDNFFYYFSNLHDGIRADRVKAFKAGK